MEVEIGGKQFKASPGKNVRCPSQQMSLTWGFIPVIYNPSYSRGIK
jgi:hypothetical protein